KPIEQMDVRAAVRPPQGRWHENDSSDQLGAHVLRHRLIAGVKCLLVEVVTRLQPRQQLLLFGNSWCARLCYVRHTLPLLRTKAAVTALLYFGSALNPRTQTRWPSATPAHTDPR